MNAQVIGPERPPARGAWSILRGMAKTPRWRRANSSGPESGPVTDEAGVTAEATSAPVRTDPEPDPTAVHATTDAAYVPSGFELRHLTPFLLLRAAHPRQGVLTAFGMAVAAAFAGRPGRELLLVFATVLVGQTILGWANDLVDRRRDLRHARITKPVATGRLDAGTVWFSLAIAVFVLVPLSVGNGINAATAYLVSVAIGLLGQWPALRRGFLSWLPWAAAWALYPAFLSYGGWGGQVDGAPPEISMTVLAALLGVGVHFLTSLWGLVADNEDGWRYLPLKLGLRIGASRLLWVSLLYVALVLAAMAYVGSHSGLAQEPL